MPLKDKKIKVLNSHEVKGFEEFLSETDINVVNSQDKKNIKESSFEGLTLLKNDEARLIKIKDLFSVKIPLAEKYDQSSAIMNEQTQQIEEFKKELFSISEKNSGGFKSSLSEIFNSYFGNY